MDTVDQRPFHPATATRRVERSFAFVDLCGFCDFADEHGDDAAASELAELRRAVRGVVQAFGVRVDKWLGDGAMLVGVESEPLVASTLAVAHAHEHERGLRVRAGVASGEVLLLEGDDYVGRPVNLAARLCDMAEAGQVLAARQGLRIPGWVTVAERLTLEVRGFHRPVEVVSLVAREGGRDHPVGAVLDGLVRPVRSMLRPRVGGTRPAPAPAPSADPAGDGVSG